MSRSIMLQRHFKRSPAGQLYSFCLGWYSKYSLPNLPSALAPEVTPVGDGMEFSNCLRVFGLCRHVSQLVTVMANVGDLMGNDKVMFGVEGNLDVVTDLCPLGIIPVSRSLVAIDRASGSVSEICLSGVSCNWASMVSSCSICCFSLVIFPVAVRSWLQQCWTLAGRPFPTLKDTPRYWFRFVPFDGQPYWRCNCGHGY